MNYDKLTNDYAKWLFPLIDRYDWGQWNKKEDRPGYKATDDQLACFYKGQAYPPQKMTRTALERHLHRKDALYYVPSRSSGFCLLMIDLDAHHGEPDAFEAAEWIRGRFFPDAYLEPSKRGFHLYVSVRVGRCPRWRFNHITTGLQSALKTLLADNNFAACVEVKAPFTLVTSGNDIERRGALSALPFLPNGSADLDRLTSMSVYLPCVFGRIFSDAALTVEFNEFFEEDGWNEGHDTYTSGISSLPQSKGKRVVAQRESSCAWERMQFVCFDFTALHRRLPTVPELLDAYQETYQTEAADKKRTKRAKDAIKYRAKTFDPYKASEGGYSTSKDKLLAAVREHCLDRTSKYTSEVTDEDLAIALYTYTRISFSVSETPRRQWTAGYEAIKGMFSKLAAEGLTERGCGNRNKGVALKTILERAGLVECFDSKWVSAGKQFGISKKYTIGPKHWRYGEFVRFAESIQCVKVDQIKGERKTVTEEPELSHALDDAWRMVA